MNTNDKLYQDLFNKFVKANPLKTKQKCQIDVNKIWKNEVKSGVVLDKDKYFSVVGNLDDLIAKQQKTVNIRNFFKRKKSLLNNNNQRDKSLQHTNDDENINDNAAGEDITAPDEIPPNTEGPSNGDKTTDANDEGQASPSTPAQDRIKTLLAVKQKTLNQLFEARAVGLEGDTAKLLVTNIKQTKDDIKDLEKLLRKRKLGMRRNITYRARRKATEKKLMIEHPEFASALKLRDSPGRPRIECDQPDILKTILEIATIGSACGDRRREDLFRTVKTLDDLHKAISDLGFTISRSGLYLKLLPRDSRTNEGKRHVNTVPVRLVRPQNDLR